MNLVARASLSGPCPETLHWARVQTPLKLIKKERNLTDTRTTQRTVPAPYVLTDRAFCWLPSTERDQLQLKIGVPRSGFWVGHAWPHPSVSGYVLLLFWFVTLGKLTNKHTSGSLFCSLLEACLCSALPAVSMRIIRTKIEILIFVVIFIANVGTAVLTYY